MPLAESLAFLHFLTGPDPAGLEQSTVGTFIRRVRATLSSPASKLRVLTDLEHLQFVTIE
eukprot:COSAG02_NODE_23538_length_715_cov_1.782468_2_plen_59_part_01